MSVLLTLSPQVTVKYVSLAIEIDVYTQTCMITTCIAHVCGPY